MDITRPKVVSPKGTLPHRTLDFGLYTVYKFLGVKRSNISKYGRGFTDKHPIVL